MIDTHKMILRRSRATSSSPHESPDTPPWHHLVHQQFELRTILIVDAAEQHAILPQQITRDDETLEKELDPSGEPPRIVLIYEAVVVDEVPFFPCCTADQ